MKIYPDSGIKQLQNIQRKQPAAPAEKTGKAEKGDKVDFSQQLRDIQLGKAQGVSGDSAVDAERQARLDSVRQRIAENAYMPESSKVAESLLKYIVEGK